MKNILIVLVSLMLVSTGPATTYAAGKTKPRIAKVKLDGDVVNFSVQQDKKFIFASNRYILHIGGKEFMRYRQAYEHGKGNLTFLISKKDYDMIAEGKSVYLSYGNSEAAEWELEDMSKHDYPTCWYLGKFSKQL